MQYKNEYRRSIDDYKPAIPIKREIKLYWILAALRIILTLIPQTGYIHPDEYFQSVEVIAGDQFDIDVYKPWEFNSTFPIRTAFIPQLIVGVPFSFLKKLAPYAFHFCGISLKSPYFLLIFPRILMCGISFTSDYCLYKICCMCGQNYKVRLITFASSYIMLTYATRIFSNSIELVLTSLLLYYTSQCMVYSEKVTVQSDYLSTKYNKAKNGVERVKYYKLLTSLPPHSLNHCFKIATITVIGIFNRPTFVCFAFSPIFFWLQRGLGSKSIGFLDFHLRIFIFIIYAIPTAILFILLDSFYFGYLTMAEIGNFEISINNFVVTPLNFIKYNADVKNLENHGLHPHFVHFLLNVPLLYNILGIIGLFTFGKMLCSGIKGKWLELPRIQSIVGLMTASFIVPIILLSLFPHQEPRFIIPIILPLVFLHAPRLSQVPGVDTVSRITKDNACYDTLAKKYKPTNLQIIWHIVNIGLCLFYGFVHQGGVLSLTSRMATELKAKPYLTHIHLYTSYTYSIPTALLQLRNTQKTYISSGNHKYRLVKDFYLYEQGSKDMTEVYNNIVQKIQECEEKWTLKKIPYRLYYAFPASAIDEFAQSSFQNSTQLFSYYTIANFYPHFSTEKLPSVMIINKIINTSNVHFLSTQSLTQIAKDIYAFLQQFGLLLIRIENSISNTKPLIRM